MPDFSAAEDIATLLDTLGFGSYTTNGTIVSGELPDTPDEVIAVRDSPGYASEEAFDDPAVFTYPAVQIAVRGATWDAAKTKAIQVWRGLTQYTGGTLNGIRYHYAKPAQMPFQMPSDSNGPSGRKLFVFNVDACADKR